MAAAVTRVDSAIGGRKVIVQSAELRTGSRKRSKKATPVAGTTATMMIAYGLCAIRSAGSDPRAAVPQINAPIRK